jgi:L-asparagine transporter-like permease
MLVFLYHEFAITFGWSLTRPLLVTCVLFIAAVLLQLSNGPGLFELMAVVVTYQFLTYFLMRLCFVRFEKREPRMALWKVGVARRYYVDWNYWAAWVVVAVGPPILFEDWLGT